VTPQIAFPARVKGVNILRARIARPTCRVLILPDSGYSEYAFRKSDSHQVQTQFFQVFAPTTSAAFPEWRKILPFERVRILGLHFHGQSNWPSPFRLGAQGHPRSPSRPQGRGAIHVARSPVLSTTLRSPWGDHRGV